MKWFDIPGFEGKYQISMCGKVKSIRREVFCRGWKTRVVPEKILPHRINNYGYPQVMLSNGKKSVTKLVHRIIAEVFIPNPANLPEVNHKDENTLNFSPENLEWCDRKYNLAYTKIRSPHKKITWQNCGGRKLTAEQVLEIRKIGRSVKQKALAARFGVARQTISRVLLGQSFTGLKYSEDK